jgi:hypothetical protein
MPYLDSDEQIHQLLEAAKNMPTTHSVQPWTYHCLFGLLAVTGLHISEALNLRHARKHGVHSPQSLSDGMKSRPLASLSA